MVSSGTAGSWGTHGRTGGINEGDALMVKNLISVFLTLVLAVGAAEAADAVKVVPQQRAMSTEGGRFVFAQISDMRRDQYMLDTKTGRLWQVVERTVPRADGKGTTSYTVLQPVPYTDDNGKETSEPKQ